MNRTLTMFNRLKSCVSPIVFGLFLPLVTLNIWSESSLMAASAGYDALAYTRSSDVWFDLEIEYQDAQTRTSPPDSLYYDRTIISRLNTGGNLSFSAGAFGFRVQMLGENSQRNSDEADPPYSPKENLTQIYSPSLDFTYVTPKGLELFLGRGYKNYAYENSRIEGSAANSKTSYKRKVISATRLGLVKRQNSWDGSFYFILGSEGKRDFTRTSSDQSKIKGDHSVQIPSEYGLAAKIKLASSYLLFDLANVQAGEGGERTTTGTTVLDDYLRIILNYSLQINSELMLDLGIRHQTLSYSNNAYARIDTIPLSSGTVKFILGPPSRHFFVSGKYGFGHDGADITEYKTRFKIKLASLRIGIFNQL